MKKSFLIIFLLITSSFSFAEETFSFCAITPEMYLQKIEIKPESKEIITTFSDKAVTVFKIVKSEAGQVACTVKADNSTNDKSVRLSFWILEDFSSEDCTSMNYSWIDDVMAQAQIRIESYDDNDYFEFFTYSSLPNGDGTRKLLYKLCK